MSDQAQDSIRARVLGRKGGSATPGTPPVDVMGGSISVGWILLAARRHWILVIAIAGFTTAFALTAFRQPALYRANAVLRLAGERQAIAGGIDNENQMVDRHVVPVQSLFPRVRSRAVIGAVVDRLGLQLRPVPVFSMLRPPIRPAIGITGIQVDPTAEADTLTLLFSTSSLTVRRGERSVRHAYGDTVEAGSARFVIANPPPMAGALLAVVPREIAIDQVLAQLAVVPLTGTDALEIRYGDTDPLLAQAVTNAVVRTFYASTINSSQDKARRRRVFLEEQLRETDRQLAQAQAGVSGFRSRRQLASSSDKLAQQQSALMNLDVRRGELQTDARVFRSLLERLETMSDSARVEELYNLAYSPEIATDPIVGRVFQQLLTYESRLDSLTTGPYRTTATNPDVVQLRQLVRSTQGELVRAFRARLSSIEERLAALQDLRSENAAAIAALPSLEAEERRLEQRADALADFANQVRMEYQKARMSEALAAADIEILDLATLPYAPTGIPRWIKLALALVFGLGLGMLIAVLLELRNRAIRGPEELEAALQLRGLAVIPPVEEAIAAEEALATSRRERDGGRLKPGPRGIVTDSSASPSVGGEAFRLLYSSLTTNWEGRQRTILVTSVAPQEGKTLVAANLAVTFAREGARVLVVDCDLRRPRLHKVFQVSRAPGLVDLLRPSEESGELEYAGGTIPRSLPYSMAPGLHRDGEEDPVVTNGAARIHQHDPRLPNAFARYSASFRNIREASSQGLWLLPSGASAPNAAATLRAGTFRCLLQEISIGFDLVILDTPPVLVSADAAILAPIADDVLLVIRAGQTDRQAAERARQQLTDAGGHVVGAVLNDPEGKVVRDRTMYYAYGYPVTPD
jgi:polysaccharide biosynthesis transport protein